MTKLKAEALARTRTAYLSLAKNQPAFDRNDLLDRAADITQELLAGGWTADKDGNVTVAVERRKHPRFTVAELVRNPDAN